MSLTNAEFRAILEDETKCILEDITWSNDEDHSPASEFRAVVQSGSGWPLFVQGRHNPKARTLSYSLVLKTTGRIYALDLGKDHHNPQCVNVGTRRQHGWSERYRDKEAFVPEDITAAVSDPVAVWNEFCAAARIRHSGVMSPPPKEPRRLFG